MKPGDIVQIVDERHRFPHDEPEELSESDALARLADAEDARLLAATPDLPPRPAPKKPSRVPSELRDRVLTLRGKGDSIKRISEATGLAWRTVRRILDRAREVRE